MNIGLVAHDAKKKLMQNFCIAYRGILSKHNLYATETTGILVENVTNLSIHKYLAGHLGGKQQLGSQIEHNQMDLLIFFRDPLTPHSHEPDVNDIVKLCDIYNIPIATNIATAEALILAHYALVAGFTEIGETLEETVQREVLEETGLRVKNIRYYKSQPWGIVDDILAGFYCDVDGETDIHMDESELKLAEWKTREELELQPDDFSLTNEMMLMFKNGRM